MQSVALDKWQLLSPLGTGGMGEVWVARHSMLGHLGAIKLMYSEMAADQREVARFVQEGQIAAQLRHRNIVRVKARSSTSASRA
jgi:serine/threonine protein kinase